MNKISGNEVLKNKKVHFIRVSNVSKIYKVGTHEFYALNNVNLEFFNEKLTVVLGPMGAGKSTFFNCLVAQEVPTQGNIYYGQVNLFKLQSKELEAFVNKNVGKVYPDLNLIDYLTVEENIRLRMELLGDVKKFNEFKDFVEKLDLAYLLNRDVERLSKKDQVIASILKELSIKPAYFILDEPDAQLHSTDKTYILELIKELTNELRMVTVYFTSDYNLAAKASRVIRIDSGKII